MALEKETRSSWAFFGQDLMKILHDLEFTPAMRDEVADARVRRGAERFDRYFHENADRYIDTIPEDFDWRNHIIEALKAHDVRMESTYSCVAGLTFRRISGGYDDFSVAVGELGVASQAVYFGFEHDIVCDYGCLLRAWERLLGVTEDDKDPLPAY